MLYKWLHWRERADNLAGIRRKWSDALDLELRYANLGLDWCRYLDKLWLRLWLRQRLWCSHKNRLLWLLRKWIELRRAVGREHLLLLRQLDKLLLWQRRWCKRWLWQQLWLRQLWSVGCGLAGATFDGRWLQLWCRQRLWQRLWQQLWLWLWLGDAYLLLGKLAHLLLTQLLRRTWAKLSLIQLDQLAALTGRAWPNTCVAWRNLLLLL